MATFHNYNKYEIIFTFTESRHPHVLKSHIRVYLPSTEILKDNVKIFILQRM